MTNTGTISQTQRTQCLTPVKSATPLNATQPTCKLGTAANWFTKLWALPRIAWVPMMSLPGSIRGGATGKSAMMTIASAADMARQVRNRLKMLSSAMKSQNSAPATKGRKNQEYEELIRVTK